MTFLSLIDNYLESLRLVKCFSILSLQSYRTDLLQALSNHKHVKMTESHLLDICRKAQTQWGHLSFASRNRKTACLKSFCKWLYEQNLTSRNLGELLQSPKVPQQIPHFLSVDEVIAVLKSHPQTCIERMLFLVLYGGGLRISEACFLKWSDVSWPQRSLRILGKGNKVRVVVLPDFVCQELKHWQALTSFPIFIFAYKQDRPLNSRTGYGWIQKLGQNSKLLKPLHPHALRHSFATHLLSSGANLRIIQHMLGHSNLVATEKYTHLGIDQLARVMSVSHPLHTSKLRNAG